MDSTPTSILLVLLDKYNQYYLFFVDTHTFKLFYKRIFNKFEFDVLKKKLQIHLYIYYHIIENNV